MGIRLENNIGCLPVNFLKGNQIIYFYLVSLIMMSKFQWKYLPYCYVRVFIPKGKYIFQKLLRNTIVFRRQHYVCFWSICVTFWYMLSGLINPVDVCETWSNFTWSELLHLTYHHVTLKVKLKTITNQHKLCTLLKYFRKTEVIFKDK